MQRERVMDSVYHLPVGSIKFLIEKKKILDFSLTEKQFSLTVQGDYSGHILLTKIKIPCLYVNMKCTTTFRNSLT